jgi:hypothetical protein
LNIPFPPSEIFLFLFPIKPSHSSKGIKDRGLFPAENKQGGRFGESIVLTEKNLNGIDFRK